MDIFNLLVNYHSNVNLEKVLKHIKNGRVINSEGKPHEEGEEECEWYKGLLIMANGDTLVDRLYEKKVINHKPEEFYEVRSNEDFLRYISNQRNSDGAYIYDSKNGRIMRVAEINNNPNTLPNQFKLEDRLPKDFVSYNGEKSLDLIGLKTRLAVRLPAAYDHTEAFQIKRSAYTDFGMGKVTHFNGDGLLEEFFFKYDPAKGVIGVNRRYERNASNKLVKVAEREKEIYKKLELVA
nr:hypothetical protein [Candidatus Woesearchaeota archaeon]